MLLLHKPGTILGRLGAGTPDSLGLLITGAGTGVQPSFYFTREKDLFKGKGCDGLDSFQEWFIYSEVQL